MENKCIATTDHRRKIYLCTVISAADTAGYLAHWLLLRNECYAYNGPWQPRAATGRWRLGAIYETVIGAVTRKYTITICVLWNRIRSKYLGWGDNIFVTLSVLPDSYADTLGSLARGFGQSTGYEYGQKKIAPIGIQPVSSVCGQLEAWPESPADTLDSRARIWAVACV